MTVAVLALRGAAAVLVLTTLVGGIPRLVQLALAAAVGLWSALLVAPVHPTYVSLAFVAQELALGAALGVAAAVPLLAAATAGRLVDIAASGRAHGPYGKLFGVLAAGVFVGIDGHVAVVAAIVDSRRVFPGVAGVFAALLPAAIRIAAPWLVTAAVVQIAIGAGTRVAGRAAAHVPTAAAVPAALVMMTASLVATLAVAMATMMRGAL